MKREEGYYWVLVMPIPQAGQWDQVGKWEIAFWQVIGNYGTWLLTGDEECYQDDHFEEIDENRITRNELMTGEQFKSICRKIDEEKGKLFGLL